MSLTSLDDKVGSAGAKQVEQNKEGESLGQRGHANNIPPPFMTGRYSNRILGFWGMLYK